MIRKLFNSMTRTSAEQAMERTALLQGEYTYASVMYDYYCKEITRIDPYEDHWGFAEVREKQLNHFADMARLSRAVDEAQAKVKATQEAGNVSSGD